MILALLLAVLLGAVPAAGTPRAADGLQQAIDAYRAEQYGLAAGLFSELAEAETDDQRAAVLHVNAGTAAAKADRPGEAVWQLRRALHLAPRDEIAAVNLERVLVLLGEGKVEQQSFTETLLGVPLLMTRRETATLAASLAGLALLLLAVLRWRGRARRGAWLAGVLLVLAALGVGIGRLAWNREEARAIVIDEVVNGHAEPDERSEIRFRLAAGTTVMTEELRRDWRL
ncbi:MAG: hypothetical protein ACYTCU_06540, partial [Planctomycetota bacterium]